MEEFHGVPPCSTPSSKSGGCVEKRFTVHRSLCRPIAYLLVKRVWAAAIGRRSQFNIFMRYGLGYKFWASGGVLRAKLNACFIFQSKILTLKRGSGRQWGLRRGRGRSSPTLEKALSITDNIPSAL